MIQRPVRCHFEHVAEDAPEVTDEPTTDPSVEPIRELRAEPASRHPPPTSEAAVEFVPKRVTELNMEAGR